MINTIIVSNVDEVYAQISCEEGIAYELSEFFTFEVPGFRFTPAFKSRLWDGKIRLFNLRNRQLYRGLIDHLTKFCKDRDYTILYVGESYNNEFSANEAGQFIDSLNLPLTPHDYQVKAFIDAIRTKRSLLLSPTASGKSLIIYLIARYLNAKRLLVIVPTISLVSQLATDFSDYGYDSSSNVHSVYAGQDKHSDRPITISTWQSLYTMPKEYFHQFDAIIGDEAHLFKAKSLTHIMTSLVNAKYRIGTTGTLDGTKTHKLVLEGLFGPVKKVTTTSELMERGIVADFTVKCLLLKHNDSVCQAAKKFTYQEEIKYLILNESRNRLIQNLALSLDKGNTLILYQYVDLHGKILYNNIKEKIGPNRKCFLVYGKTEGDTREEIRHIVENEKDAIIIASFGTFSTGINIKNLHNIIFASPSKSRIRNLQSIGRGLRVSDTKTEATLFDIADDLRHGKHENFTLKHFALRLKLYSEEKFNFRVYKISLK